jgi:hypothetical protein
MYISAETAIQYTLASKVKGLSHSTDQYLIEERTNAIDIFPFLAEIRSSKPLSYADHLSSIYLLLCSWSDKFF